MPAVPQGLFRVMTHVYVVVYVPVLPVIEKVYDPSGKEIVSVLVKV